MKNYLLLTLGHNSSALFVDKNGKVIGYEQERLDGIKSSSHFPSDAIAEIIKHVGYKALDDCAIRISHWFDFQKYDVYINKYITKRDMMSLLELSADVKFVDNDFTHHDAHAFSVLAFFNHYYDTSVNIKPKETALHTIVADGFGNNGEVISIYKYHKLVTRIYGYHNSLGLMYQFATSFCSMKENQDEYKFLGYESHINEYFSDADISVLEDGIKARYYMLIINMFHSFQFPYKTDNFDVINMAELNEVKANWYSVFRDNLNILGIEDSSSFAARCAIAYYIQSILERIIKYIIDTYKMHNVLVAGGIFYNVKLNNVLVKHVPGLVSIMPLAGDQGAAIGMYTRETGKYIDFSLLYGKRDMYHFDKLSAKVENVEYNFIETEDDEDRIVENIATLIVKGHIVNLVNGKMEFGPRALCNTSTLFLPTHELVAQNNSNNNRNEVMPCAPVIRIENAQQHFNLYELDKVIGSNRFMICTHDYLRSDGFTQRHYGGMMHKKPQQHIFTGRPQFISCGLVWKVLKIVEEQIGITALVNTSFNAHGNPIVFNPKQIIDNFKYQLNNAKTNKPYLFVIKYEEAN